MEINSLSNVACIYAGKCLDCCGMCHLKSWQSPSGNFKSEERFIHHKSLFGLCRAYGLCMCNTCQYINGKKTTHDYEREVLEPTGRKLIVIRKIGKGWRDVTDYSQEEIDYLIEFEGDK